MLLATDKIVICAESQTILLERGESWLEGSINQDNSEDESLRSSPVSNQ